MPKFCPVLCMEWKKIIIRTFWYKRYEVPVAILSNIVRSCRGRISSNDKYFTMMKVSYIFYFRIFAIIFLVCKKSPCFLNPDFFLDRNKTHMIPISWYMVSTFFKKYNSLFCGSTPYWGFFLGGRAIFSHLLKLNLNHQRVQGFILKNNHIDTRLANII